MSGPPKGGSFVPEVSPPGETQGEGAVHSLSIRGYRLLTRAARFKASTRGCTGHVFLSVSW